MNSGTSYEVGSETSQTYIEQIVIKFALKCEMCLCDKDQPELVHNEVRLVAAKVTSVQPSRKSYIVICPNHFSKIDEYLNKFLEVSQIQYTVSPTDIKKAKLVLIPEDIPRPDRGINDQAAQKNVVVAQNVQEINNVNNNQQEIKMSLNDAILQIQNNYCCRILKLRLSKIDKQIQILNCDEVKETISSAFEQKKKVLEATQKKFENYVKNQHRMSDKQKFLICHYFLRLQKKSRLGIKDFRLKHDQEINPISNSISMSFIDLH